MIWKSMLYSETIKRISIKLQVIAVCHLPKTILVEKTLAVME